MLQKSKRSALILSAVTVLIYALTELGISLALEYKKTGQIPGIQNVFATSLPFYWLVAIAVILMVIFIGLGGLVIHQIFKNDLYYGWGGAFRWGLFGFLYAVSQQTYRYIESSLPWYLRILDLVWAAMAWGIAFILIPVLFKKKDEDVSGIIRNL